MLYSYEQLAHMIAFTYCVGYIIMVYFSIRIGFWISKQIFLIAGYIHCFISSYNAERDTDGKRYKFFRYIVMYFTDERCPYFERWKKRDS